MTKTQFETTEGKSLSEVYNLGLTQPTGAQTSCIYVYPTGSMGVWPCESSYNFICKKIMDNPSSISESDGQKSLLYFRPDYTYLEPVKNFYKIHATAQTWEDAKRVCAQEGATFWHPDNNDEAQAVFSLWKTSQPQIAWVYTSLSNKMTKTQFETTEGKSLYEVYNIGLTQPTGAQTNCIYIYSTGTMGVWPCESQYNFICKKKMGHQRIISESVGHFFRKDYYYIEAIENFYKIHTIPRTWADAKRVCALEGATFWYPDNDYEARAVNLLWNSTQSNIWKVNVGMSDIMAEGLFETIDGKLASEVYNNWQSGQPDDDGGKQDCVQMYNNGTLDDWGCDDKRAFICKKSLQTLEWNKKCNVADLDYSLNEDNGKCYKLHTTPMSWKDSYTACRLEQSNLSVIRSREEADYLVNITKPTDCGQRVVKENYYAGIFHIGFHNRFNDGWQTVKGTPMDVDAALWDNNQPADDRDQCGSMLHTGRLISIDCDVKSFFICEHEFTNSTLEL